MNDSMKRKKIRHYFSPFPKWTITCILIGFCFILIGFLFYYLFILFGFIIIGIAVFILYLYFKDMPTDQQIDKWFAEDLQELKSKAIIAMGTDESQFLGELQILISPILWKTSGVSLRDLVSKKGKDRLTRFGIYNILIVAPLEKCLSYYKVIYNFLKHITINDSTGEYYYKDIVFVGTQEKSTSYTLPNGSKLVSKQSFVIKISSGDSLEIVCNEEAVQNFYRSSIPITSSEKATQVLRTLVREKK